MASDRLCAHLALHLAAAVGIVAVLLAARFAFLLSYGSADALFASGASWLWGLRLDLRVAAIATAPSLLFGWWLPRQWLMRWLWGVVMAVFGIAIVNHYWYRNFQAPIDPQLFAFFSDPESLAPVLATIITQYPWLSAVALLLAVGWLTRALLARVPSPQGCARLGFAQRLAVALGAVALWFLAARGSLGTFPLTPNRIPSLGAPLLDAAVINGPIALATAWSDYQRNATLPAISEAEAKRAWRTLFGTPPPADLLAAMIRPSQPHGKGALPHIVVVQMESMGAAVLALDGVEGNDLLGRLRRWWQRAFAWPAAVSAGLGTHITLERITAGAFIPHISRGAYRRIPLAGAYPAALRKLGYRTVFVTGGVKRWSHFDEFLPAQGFEEVVGQAEILRAIPEAKTDGTWGVHDEYLFRYALQRLQSAKQPTFLYLMTISNHSPYQLPPQARIPMQIPERWRKRMIDAKQAPMALAAYRYAADQLGAFLDALQRKGLLARTIVAATGDHYMRDAMNYHRVAEDAARSYFVPILLWLPPALRAELDYDPRRPASHLDLMPTILARLPRPVRAFQTGVDLLSSATKTHPLAFALGEGFAANACGCVIGKARFRWRDRIGGDVVAASPDDPCLQALAQKKAARELLLRWATAERIRRALASQSREK